jgi:2-dehydro-3-deoxygluconokinase
MKRIVLIGEAMIELSKNGEHWRMGYGGDTLNTAIHLARLGHDVAYLTALGNDPLSAEIKASWAAEGLDTSLVLDHPTRNTGLYSISTDATGERSFSYWRDTSAARELFSLPGIEAALAQAEQADLVAYSLITLAVLPEAAHERLLSLSARLAFDGNYRARLWPDAASAAKARDAAISRASIGLPTLEDEILIAGATSADAVAAHWQELGCPETLVKLGVEGARLPDGSIIAPPQALNPVDTSGAGDAFNAGYLHGRLAGASVAEAAMEGHRLAGWVVMRTGAIPARDLAWSVMTEH